MDFYICGYCNESYSSDNAHTETECKDIIIEKINKKLDILNIYVLKQLYNYILSL